MCGICGILDFGDRPLEAAVINRMRDMMVERGPDDAGTHLLPHICLGHRRLSIIDLSERGRQPMCNEDGSVWIVFNGEIYNFTELRNELEAAGHTFRSDTDTEVLIHGFEEWGIDRLLERINGMFAFAIWDAPRKELFLARDRLGKKPLYYAQRGQQFLFGSDIKAIWAFDPGGWRVRRESLATFLFWRYFPGQETVYEGVQQLLPAHYLRVTARGWESRRYWRLSFARKLSEGLPEVMEGTADVIARAVRRRLRSDVPLGAFLSGGVDSSYIVSWMANGSAHPVRTFAMGTEDPEHDERSAARAVALHCATEHTEFQVSAEAWSLLPRLVWAYGQPFGDAAAIPTYYVSQCDRRHVTVALTGDGGDESFAGYSQHQAHVLTALVGRLTPSCFFDAFLPAGRSLLDAGTGHPAAAAARFLRYVHPDPMVSMAPVTSWALHHIDQLWPGDSQRLTDPDLLLGYAMKLKGEFDGVSPLDASLHMDLHHLLPFCYNVKLDVATMMNSLEARSPLQDREVVEWAARIDPGMKLKPWEKKHLLKRLAAQRIPPEVVYRPKHGFSIPLDGWFLGPWAQHAHDIILGWTARGRDLFNYEYIERLWGEHQARRARHGTRFWLLLWLELWFRMFIDRTMTAADPMPAN